LENDKKALKIKEKTRPLKDNLFSINKLFSTINIHTKEYIDKEIAFFKKYPTDKTDKIIDSLNAIKKEIAGLTCNEDSQNVCILKMSAGSGAHSITGDYLWNDYTVSNNFVKGKKVNEQAPKSRKVAIHDNNFSLMGFVKLRTMTDEEVAIYEAALSEEKAKKIVEQQRIAEENRLAEEQRRKEEAERLAAEKAEKERIAKEKAEKEAAERAERERLAAMSPDDREKEKYQNGTSGELINASLQNSELTTDFFQWLKEKLITEKSWKIDGDAKKDKSIKRCLAIEDKLK
jgi:hypothetical protein